MLQGLLYGEASLPAYLFVTFVLGGAAGALSGRAIARIWRPWWMILPAACVIGIGVRFIHFALFEAAFFAPMFFVADTIIALIFAFAGFRIAQQRLMAQQYGFLSR